MKINFAEYHRYTRNLNAFASEFKVTIRQMNEFLTNNKLWVALQEEFETDPIQACENFSISLTMAKYLVGEVA